MVLRHFPNDERSKRFASARRAGNMRALTPNFEVVRLLGRMAATSSTPGLEPPMLLAPRPDPQVTCKRTWLWLGPAERAPGSTVRVADARDEDRKSGSPGMFVGEVTRALVRMGV